jgi:hypothetical protein
VVVGPSGRAAARLFLEAAVLRASLAAGVFGQVSARIGPNPQVTETALLVQRRVTNPHA